MMSDLVRSRLKGDPLSGHLFALAKRATKAWKITESCAASLKPPNAKARRHAVSLKRCLHEAPNRRRLSFTETHSQKRMPTHQKLLREKKRTIQAKLY